MDAEEVEVRTLAQWHSWLRRHHALGGGIWLIYPRKAPGQTALTYDELVDEAVCWGWIDSKPGRVDELRAKLYFAPRKPTSAWSAKNKARVERLRADGRLQAAGEQAVEAAKQRGNWDRLDSVEALEIPTDLRAAFRLLPGSLKTFQSFSRTNQRMVLEWVASAKRPGTRARRVTEVAEKAARNEVANLWSAKRAGGNIGSKRPGV